jgi:hypothetical protein
MSYEEKQDFDQLVGIKDGVFHFLDYVFEHDGGMRGAVGTRIVPVSKQHYENRKDEYYDPEWSPLKKVYEETDYDDMTFEEFVDSQFRQWGRELILDFSGYEHKETVQEYTDAWEIECIGGGRMFGSDISPSDYDTVVNEHLIDVIREYES